MSQHTDVRFTLGAVLAGAFFSTALSGSVCLQTFLYVRHYPKDPKQLKALVAAVWQVKESSHRIYQLTPPSSLIGVWTLRKQFASQRSVTTRFYPSELFFQLMSPLGTQHCGALTALLTVTVNGSALLAARVYVDLMHSLSFFCHRVHRLSQGNWWITVPTIICLVTRLGLAIATGVEMSILQSFTLYGNRFRGLLTAALGLSAATDVIITAGLCYYLRHLNRGLYRTRKMLSTIVSFADNNGALTCIVALASLICWVVMPNNLVYLGFHFTIGKFYSNSFLATLNMRDYIKRSAGAAVDVVNVMNPVPGQTAYPMASRGPARWPGVGGGSATSTPFYEEEQSKLGNADGAGPLEIKVDTTVHYD
ncbi:hypothetical protein BC834DRAFT_965656 [Gloeopeniophorella convolvens]|nr:hypothetical protein BC834DRAFT_965656 [Gloeopeniophorella convolvens]